MSYVIIEFVCENEPQLVESDLALERVALCLCLRQRDLIEQSGPTPASTTVWNARTEELVAIWHPMPSLHDFVVS